MYDKIAKLLETIVYRTSNITHFFKVVFKIIKLFLKNMLILVYLEFDRGIVIDTKIFFP